MKITSQNSVIGVLNKVVLVQSIGAMLGTEFALDKTVVPLPFYGWKQVGSEGSEDCMQDHLTGNGHSWDFRKQEF